MDLNSLCDELQIDCSGPLASIFMNRPHSLNAMTMEMVRVMRAALVSWRDDSSIKAVLISGLPDEAFSAGGDMKSVYNIGMAYRREQAHERIASVFFAEEYELDRLIYNYPKPVIAFMNGITMGGAYGIGGPSAFRIVCENTVFAMPEAAMGFFPDVGSAYYLNKCPGKIGDYLALTGYRINADDMLYSRLADFFLPLEKRADLIALLGERLKDACDYKEAHHICGEIIKNLAENPPMSGNLRRRAEKINLIFSASGIEEIIDKLYGADWGGEVSGHIISRSPTSIKVILRHMRECVNAGFEEILAKDFIIGQHFINGHDFYEGVRAVLIDKDNSPLWVPSNLRAVSDDQVGHYFAETGFSLEDVMDSWPFHDNFINLLLRDYGTHLSLG